MDKILYLPTEGTTGFWGLRAFPQEPTDMYMGDQYYGAAMDEYQRALESCKSNKLEIIDPTATMLLGQYKPGDLFDLPVGFEFKEEETNCKKWCGGYGCLPIEKKCHWVKHPKKFLRLVKIEAKDIPKAKDYIEYMNKQYSKPEPEESQVTEFDIIDFFRPYFKEVSDACRRGHNLNGRKMKGAQVDSLIARIREDLQKNFTIQRKKQ